MKRPLLLAAAAVLGVGLAAPSAALGATVAAQQDWTRVVAATPEGGFRVGNPDAPVKLVEYGSLTCIHCAHFARDGVPELLGTYVKSGRLSYEFRNFVRDPADLAGALLSRCAGADDFFALTGRYFADRDQWIGKLQAMSETDMNAVDALPIGQRLPRLAALAGLDVLAAKAGITAGQAKQCLSDETAINRLIEMRRIAVEEHGLQGTPTFLINGKKAEGAYDWAALEPLLGSPGG